MKNNQVVLNTYEDAVYFTLRAEEEGDADLFSVANRVRIALLKMAYATSPPRAAVDRAKRIPESR